MSVQITEEWGRAAPSVFDVSGAERDMVVVYGFLFDGRLDTDKLQAAWRKLVHKWPILGGRLRDVENVSEADKASRAVHWEYRIPPAHLVDEILDQDMSLLRPEATRSFVIDHREGKVEDHYSFIRGADLPQDRPTATHSKPTTETLPDKRTDEFKLWASNGPLTQPHLLREDRALATVKVTTFENATAIGFSLPHVLFDGPAAIEPVRAFAKIVNGQEDEVEPLSRFGHDFYRTLAPGGEEAEKAAQELKAQGGKSVAPEVPTGWYSFSGWEMFRFVVRFAWDLLWTRPVSMMESREIYLPKEYVTKLKADAQAEVSKICAEEDAASGQKTWISTSDVVHAYTLKLMCKADARGDQDQTPATMAFPVNMRYTLPPTGCEPLPDICLTNAAYMVIMPEQPISKIVHEYSIGQIALLLRKAAKEQARPEKMRRALIWRLASAAQGKLLAFFRPHFRWYVGTNWRKMGMYDISLAGARRHHPADTASSPPPPQTVVSEANFGKTVKVYYAVILGEGAMAVPLRNAFNQMTDDPAGGIWVTIPLATWQWDRLDLEYVADPTSVKL